MFYYSILANTAANDSLCDKTYVDSMWGEDFHGKYLQVTVIPEGMECDHMFVDDSYEGINLFPITRI